MDRTAEVTYGVTGQVVEVYPPEWALGVPSSATCDVFDGTRSNDDTSDVDFSPTVTIDSVNTTVTTASGYSQSNRKRLYVSLSTSSVGKEYRVENASGQFERVLVKSVSVGSYADLADDLQNDYPVGSTVKGLRMYFTVDPTWVATEANISTYGEPPYRVIWKYTVGGIARRFQTYLKLVRHQARHSVTLQDLKDLWADMGDELAVQHRESQCQQILDGAEDLVRLDLLAADIPPDTVTDQEIYNGLVRAKARQVAAEQGLCPGGWDVGSFASLTEKQYGTMFQKLTPKMRQSQGTEGAITAEPLQTLWLSR